MEADRVDLKHGQFQGFTWLHLSDLHVGQPGQARLFPRFQSNLESDLETLARRVAKPFDLIVFSGDLVQKGSAEEFSLFDETVERLLARIERLQPRPKVVTVPGNHDLVRPDPLDASAIAIKQYWRDEGLQEAFWSDAGGHFRKFIAERFKHYAEWRGAAIKRGTHLDPVCEGILPGDASYQLKTAGGQLGVVALNSAWLQISASDYFGELHVDTHQLLEITDRDPDRWVRGNDASLLVTHHPTSWLRQAALSSWSNDIDPPSRFDAHLFGHMHKPETESRSRGGSRPKRSVQAASLFGLEKYSDSYDRIHGYAATSITISGGMRTMECWPRILVDTSAGAKKFVPDSSQDVDEATSSFLISYSFDERAGSTEASENNAKGAGQAKELIPRSTVDLAQFQLSLGEERAHGRVRRVEQERFCQSLLEKGVAWLASDWGMGEGGFLSAARSRLEIPADRVFRFDFSSYQSRDSFFADLQTRAGCTFQMVCDAIADAGPAIIVFSDFRLDGSAPDLRIHDIESMATAVSDFASESYVVITSARAPKGAIFSVTELRPLDEADVATYVKDSALGDERYAKPEAVSKILRHTDGVPSQIDSALRDLEIISIDDLIGSNTDLSPGGFGVSNIPAALQAAVSDLKGSDDRAERRAYDLLLALSALPQGEQLARIKRFLGSHPFGPIHARALLERSLIETVSLPALDPVTADSTNKNLVVPRYVREFVRESADESVARDVDKRAIELYFGDGWAVGEIASSPTGRRVREALCDGYEIHNASTIVIRSITRLLEADPKNELAAMVRLGLAFVEILIRGDHYRSASLLCDDLLASLRHQNGFDREASLIRYHNGRSLRMNGRHQEALASFDEVDSSFLSRSQRQHRELCISLIHVRLGDEAAAVLHANKTIELRKKGADSLHAESVIAGFIEDAKERAAALRSLLAEAERRKFFTLAGNIRISLAKHSRTEGKSSEELLRVTIRDARKNGDSYNGFRAIIDLAGELSAGRGLSSSDKNLLVDSYHFLYNERMFDLFDRCHDELWKAFEKDDDRANLIRLFRHSSFIWRLRGDEKKEVKYLRSLSRRLVDVVAIGVISADRDTAYVVVRIGAMLGHALPSGDAQ